MISKCKLSMLIALAIFYFIAVQPFCVKSIEAFRGHYGRPRGRYRHHGVGHYKHGYPGFWRKRFLFGWPRIQRQPLPYTELNSGDDEYVGNAILIRSENKYIDNGTMFKVLKNNDRFFFEDNNDFKHQVRSTQIEKVDNYNTIYVPTLGTFKLNMFY